MLLGIRWEKNALAETVPKDKQILATGDSNSIRSPIFRYFGKFGMNGRGHSPPRSKIHRRFLIHTNQPKTENHNHDLSKLFSNTSRTAVFLWAKIPIPCCPIEWKLPFVPLTPRVPPSSGIESRAVSSCLTWFCAIVVKLKNRTNLKSG